MPDVATSKTVVARICFARSRLDVAKHMPAIPGLDVARSGPYDAKPGPNVANRIRSGPDLAQTILPEQAQSWPGSGPGPYCLNWPRSGQLWASFGPVQAVWFGPDPGQTWA